MSVVCPLLCSANWMNGPWDDECFCDYVEPSKEGGCKIQPEKGDWLSDRNDCLGKGLKRRKGNEREKLYFPHNTINL